jgi:hypothetical protein
MRAPSRPSFVLLALLPALAAACGEEEKGAARRATGPEPAPTADEPVTADGPAAAATEGAGAGLANGRHAAFGLRMPQGMQPAGQPAPGVYRFEGPHPTRLVEAFVIAQLAAFDPAVAEPGAKLYRNATVRKPAGGVEPEPLAIRVHELPQGAAIDVWLERALKDPAAVSGTAAAVPPGGASGAGAAAEARKPAGKYGTPAERRRAVFEMLQKVERGEPLSKEDLDNPLFQ